MSATAHQIPAEEEIVRLLGHEFPGGNYLIEHWENFLLSECTGASLLPDGIAHPIALFHLPIIGAGTSITELFALGQAESDLSILIESYEWEMFLPLKEDILYSITGKITAAERCRNDKGGLYDRIQFRFSVSDDAQLLVARSTITWHYTRGML